MLTTIMSAEAISRRKVPANACRWNWWADWNSGKGKVKSLLIVVGRNRTTILCYVGLHCISNVKKSGIIWMTLITSLYFWHVPFVTNLSTSPEISVEMNAETPFILDAMKTT